MGNKLYNAKELVRLQKGEQEVKEMAIKSLLEAILCKSSYGISLESVIKQFDECGVTLTSEEISWVEREMILFSLEAIDDDTDEVSSEFKNCFEEICTALTNSEVEDDGLSSYDPPCRLEEEITDYSSLGNNLFTEDINQDFNEIASNCDVANDIDEKIKTIIEEMKMDW